jgi:hypothetical protein
MGLVSRDTLIEGFGEAMDQSMKHTYWGHEKEKCDYCIERRQKDKEESEAQELRMIKYTCQNCKEESWHDPKYEKVVPEDCCSCRYEYAPLLEFWLDPKLHRAARKAGLTEKSDFEELLIQAIKNKVNDGKEI